MRDPGKDGNSTGRAGDAAFAVLSRAERIALCREVMESLSDLVEGTAPPDLCGRVERLLGDCRPYRAYRDTLAATIRLLGECGEEAPSGAAGEAAFQRCVQRARSELERRRRRDDP